MLLLNDAKDKAFATTTAAKHLTEAQGNDATRVVTKSEVKASATTQEAASTLNKAKETAEKAEEAAEKASDEAETAKTTAEAAKQAAVEAVEAVKIAEAAEAASAKEIAETEAKENDFTGTVKTHNTLFEVYLDNENKDKDKINLVIDLDFYEPIDSYYMLLLNCINDAVNPVRVLLYQNQIFINTSVLELIDSYRNQYDKDEKDKNPRYLYFMIEYIYKIITSIDQLSKNTDDIIMYKFYLDQLNLLIHKITFDNKASSLNDIYEYFNLAYSILKTRDIMKNTPLKLNLFKINADTNVKLVINNSDDVVVLKNIIQKIADKLRNEYSTLLEILSLYTSTITNVTKADYKKQLTHDVQDVVKAATAAGGAAAADNLPDIVLIDGVLDLNNEKLKNHTTVISELMTLNFKYRNFKEEEQIDFNTFFKNYKFAQFFAGDIIKTCSDIKDNKSELQFIKFMYKYYYEIYNNVTDPEITSILSSVKIFATDEIDRTKDGFNLLYFPDEKENADHKDINEYLKSIHLDKSNEILDMIYSDKTQDGESMTIIVKNIATVYKKNIEDFARQRYTSTFLERATDPVKAGVYAVAAKAGLSGDSTDAVNPITPSEQIYLDKEFKYFKIKLYVLYILCKDTDLLLNYLKQNYAKNKQCIECITTGCKDENINKKIEVISATSDTTKSPTIDKTINELCSHYGLSNEHAYKILLFMYLSNDECVQNTSDCCAKGNIRTVKPGTATVNPLGPETVKTGAAIVAIKASNEISQDVIKGGAAIVANIALNSEPISTDIIKNAAAIVANQVLNETKSVSVTETAATSVTSSPIPNNLNFNTLFTQVYDNLVIFINNNDLSLHDKNKFIADIKIILNDKLLINKHFKDFIIPKYFIDVEAVKEMEATEYISDILKLYGKYNTQLFIETFFHEYSLKLSLNETFKKLPSPEKIESDPEIKLIKLLSTLDSKNKYANKISNIKDIIDSCKNIVKILESSNFDFSLDKLNVITKYAKIPDIQNKRNLLYYVVLLNDDDCANLIDQKGSKQKTFFNYFSKDNITQFNNQLKDKYTELISLTKNDFIKNLMNVITEVNNDIIKEQDVKDTLPLISLLHEKHNIIFKDKFCDLFDSKNTKIRDIIIKNVNDYLEETGASSYKKILCIITDLRSDKKDKDNDLYQNVEDMFSDIKNLLKSDVSGGVSTKRGGAKKAVDNFNLSEWIDISKDDVNIIKKVKEAGGNKELSNIKFEKSSDKIRNFIKMFTSVNYNFNKLFGTDFKNISKNVLDDKFKIEDIRTNIKLFSNDTDIKPLDEHLSGTADIKLISITEPKRKQVKTIIPASDPATAPTTTSAPAPITTTSAPTPAPAATPAATPATTPALAASTPTALAPALTTSLAPMPTTAQAPAIVINQPAKTVGKMPKFLTNSISSEKIKEYLITIDDFINKYIKPKHEMWKKQINNIIAENLQRINEILPQGKHTLDNRNQEKRVNNYIKNILYIVEDRASLNYKYNKDFFVKEGKRKVFEIMRYINSSKMLLDDKYIKANPTLVDEQKNYKYILEKYNKLLADINNANDQYYQNLILITKTTNEALTIPISKVMDMDKEDGLNLRAKQNSLDDTTLNITKGYPHKIKSLYTLNYNLMEIIMDSQFFLMYVIKGLRILFSYIAFFLATRIFSPIYEEAVYDGKKNPPSLWKYILIFVAFDASFNAFLVVLLFILKLLFKTDDNAFLIDSYLFTKYLIDYAVSMTVIIVIGVLVANVITSKKFFKYKYEGVRAIRAYESMMFNCAFVLHLFPFFLMS